MKQRWATSAFALAIGCGGGSGTLQNAASRSGAREQDVTGVARGPTPVARAEASTTTPPRLPAIPPPLNGSIVHIVPTVSCPSRMINRSPGGYSSPWILSRAYIADCPLLYTTVAVTLRLSADKRNETRRLPGNNIKQAPQLILVQYRTAQDGQGRFVSVRDHRIVVRPAAVSTERSEFWPTTPSITPASSPIIRNTCSHRGKSHHRSGAASTTAPASYAGATRSTIVGESVRIVRASSSVTGAAATATPTTGTAASTTTPNEPAKVLVRGDRCIARWLRFGEHRLILGITALERLGRVQEPTELDGLRKYTACYCPLIRASFV
uniref:Uncharacterized protein n=1 Tax=Anopheles atroparvus TaxID=41427 RepID=A0A182JI17_ANOAO